MNVVLGVAGGIAAYKSPEIVRRLMDAGHAVRVVMTAGAEAFVTPLTFQAVSGQPVHRDLLDETAEAAMGHIEFARWADVVLAAPATANLMARLAHGFADELLTTLCLATRRPDLSRAGHEPADVARGRDPGQSGHPGRTRGPDHRTGRGLAGLRRRGTGADERARGHRFRPARREPDGDPRRAPRTRLPATMPKPRTPARERLPPGPERTDRNPARHPARPMRVRFPFRLPGCGSS